MKLVFHLPYFCMQDGIVSACDSRGFKSELIDAFAASDAGYLFSAPAKTFIQGREFPVERLVLYASDDSYYGYIHIFHELICKYHRDLQQESYYYEQGDILVSLKVGDYE